MTEHESSVYHDRQLSITHVVIWEFLCCSGHISTYTNTSQSILEEAESD
jgi:hypothetical protein